MTIVTISTTLPLAEYKKIKANYWKMSELILLGVRAKEGNPQMIERIRDVEEQNKRLVEKLQKQAQRIYDLEKEVQ